jgi:hypothetical protein
MAATCLAALSSQPPKPAGARRDLERPGFFVKGGHERHSKIFRCVYICRQIRRADIDLNQGCGALRITLARQGIGRILLRRLL